MAKGEKKRRRKVHVTSPATATEICRSLKVGKKDLAAARRAIAESPRQILRRYRKDARRLRKFSSFTPLSVVERMALDCFEALEEALGPHR